MKYLKISSIILSLSLLINSSSIAAFATDEDNLLLNASCDEASVESFNNYLHNNESFNADKYLAYDFNYDDETNIYDYLMLKYASIQNDNTPYSSQTTTNYSFPMESSSCDSWKFINRRASSSEYGGFDDGETYRDMIKQEYIDKLLSQCTNTEKESINRLLDCNYGGLCYGIAALNMLYLADVFDIEPYICDDPVYDEPYLCDVDYPYNNADLQSLIVYYFLLQKTNRAVSAMFNVVENEDGTYSFTQHTITDIRHLVDKYDTVFVTFYYDKSVDVVGHAILATGYGNNNIDNKELYGVEDYSYHMSTIDSNKEPSSLNTATSIYFNRDNTWTIPRYEARWGGHFEPFFGIVTCDLAVLDNYSYFGNVYDEPDTDIVLDSTTLSLKGSTVFSSDMCELNTDITAVETENASFYRSSTNSDGVIDNSWLNNKCQITVNATNCDRAIYYDNNKIVLNANDNANADIILTYNDVDWDFYTAIIDASIGSAGKVIIKQSENGFDVTVPAHSSLSIKLNNDNEECNCSIDNNNEFSIKYFISMNK